METKGSKIFKKAQEMLGHALPAYLVHQIETIADDEDYFDEDAEAALADGDECDLNGRQQTNAFLSRVNAEEFPDNPIKEIMLYLGQGSSGVITPQWIELAEFIAETLDPSETEEEKAAEVAKEATQKADKKSSVAKAKAKKAAATPAVEPVAPAAATEPVAPAAATNPDAK